MDPTPTAPSSPPPPPMVRARRPFGWRDFFIGVVSGVLATVLGLALLATGAVALLHKIVKDDAVNAPQLHAPDFPKHADRTVYGQDDAAWKFRTLAGAPATLADYRGKVVFLNLWATWCGPCVAELPAIQKLQDAVKNDAVAFVLISDEDQAEIEKFTAKQPTSLPLFRAEHDRPPLFATVGIPTTFILDPAGVVVYRFVGAAQWNHDSVVAFIHGLLISKTATGPRR